MRMQLIYKQNHRNEKKRWKRNSDFFRNLFVKRVDQPWFLSCLKNCFQLLKKKSFIFNYKEKWKKPYEVKEFCVKWKQMKIQFCYYYFYLYNILYLIFFSDIMFVKKKVDSKENRSNDRGKKLFYIIHIFK